MSEYAIEDAQEEGQRQLWFVIDALSSGIDKLESTLRALGYRANDDDTLKAMKKALLYVQASISPPYPKDVTPGKLAKWDDTAMTDAIYIPEDDEVDRVYTKAQLILLTEGDEDLARKLFDLCDWQLPETIINEDGGLDAFRAECQMDTFTSR